MSGGEIADVVSPDHWGQRFGTQIVRLFLRDGWRESDLYGPLDDEGAAVTET